MGNVVMGLVPAAAWDLGSFLTNATSSLKGWGGLLLICAGVVAIIIAAVLAVKGLISKSAKGQQAAPTAWVAIFCLLILGGALISGGFNFVQTISSGGQQTILELGGAAAWALPW